MGNMMIALLSRTRYKTRTASAQIWACLKRGYQHFDGLLFPSFFPIHQMSISVGVYPIFRHTMTQPWQDGKDGKISQASVVHQRVAHSWQPLAFAPAPRPNMAGPDIFGYGATEPLGWMHRNWSPCRKRVGPTQGPVHISAPCTYTKSYK